MKGLIHVFLLLSLFCLNAQSDSHVNILEQDFNEFTISKHYLYSSVKEDKDINSVISNDSIFQFQEKTFLNTGFFSPYNWVKIKVANSSNLSDFIFELNQTYIDSVEFYVVKNKRIQKAFPKKGLYFEHNNNSSFLSNKYAYTYPIHIPKNDTLDFYIKAVINDGAFRAMNKIWSEKGYELRKKNIKIRTAYLIFFAGFTLLVVVISIAMFFFSKHRLYVYYAGFVSVIFLNLLALRYFVSPVYYEKYLFFGNNFLEMFTLLQVFFVMQYLKHFFSIKTYYPKLYGLIEKVALCTMVFFVLALFLRYFDWFYAFSYYLGKVLLLGVTVGFYAIAIKLCFKKEIMAYYFVVAYFPLMFFVVFYILTALKLTSSYSPLEWEFVIFFEIFVLTIAMAHRYYLLIKENLTYQKKLYEQRLKISRDLHDNIGAQLTFIISSIENLPYGFNINDSKLTEKLGSISTFTRGTIYELRDTIWAMNKNKILLEDLQVRISNFIDKARGMSNNVHFSFNIDEALSNDIEFTAIKGMNIYRIIQEAINNAFKYSGAKTISVTIYENDNKTNVEIKDDGKGFELKKIEQGNGLSNMKKRAHDIGASIDVSSKLNKGTIVKLTLDN